MDILIETDDMEGELLVILVSFGNCHVKQALVVKNQLMRVYM